MSWQKTITNFCLRIIIKPLMGRGVANRENIAKQQALLLKLTARAKLPRNIHLEARKIDGIEVEYIIASALHEKIQRSGNQQPDQQQRVLLYFHGGGFVAGSPATHRSLTTSLAKHLGCEIYAVDYRKAPDHPFPAAVEDTCQVYSALLAQGYDPGQIIFAGDSAGGNLVFTTLLRAKALALPMPAAAVAISPWGDLSLSGESYTHNQHRDVMLPVKSMREVVPLIVGEHNADEPQVSPIFGNFEGFPPLMIHVGDTEVLYSDALHLRDNAVRDAVPVLLHEWRDTPHVLPLFHQFMPEARACLYEMTLFMKQQYSRAIHETVEPVTH